MLWPVPIYPHLPIYHLGYNSSAIIVNCVFSFLCI